MTAGNLTPLCSKPLRPKIPTKKHVIESDSLKALRARFNLDFAGYVDNLLAPERRAKNPSSSDIINGFSLEAFNESDSITCFLVGIFGRGPTPQ
jgi:hypothetical protein